MTTKECPEIQGCHRYSLQVDGLTLPGNPDLGEVVFLMRNPATGVGNEARKHPTRSYCCRHAGSWGYGTCTEVNLFALRASDKPQLLQAHEQGCDLVGPENDRVIYEAVSRADLVVVAWGRTRDNKMLQRRADDVWARIQSLGRQLKCLERNRDGSPRLPWGNRPQVDSVQDLTPWP